MKNKTLLILFAILFTFQVNQLKSQTFGWTQLLSGTNAALNDVYFTSADTGYAVGDCIILKTTDGGINWVPKPTGTIYNCQNCVYFINSNYGYVTSLNCILKTIDGGNNWIPTIDSTGTDNLHSIFFPTDSIGYAVGYVGGGKIYKTTDKGNTWFKIPGPYPSSFVSYNSVYFTSKDTGYVVGNPGIYKTTDGAVNWTQQTSPTGAGLGSVFFITKNIGYIVGDNNTILKTINGGNNWVQQTINLPYSQYNQLYSVCFTSPEIGYIVGGDPIISSYTGIILKTINGGANWDLMTTPIHPIFSSVYFPVADTGYVVGLDGTILKTINGGITVGIQENNNEEGMRIYPNPNDGNMQLEYDFADNEPGVFEMFDFTGRKVYSMQLKESTGKANISAVYLSRGVYMYRLTSGALSLATGKVVVIK